jgi:para-nitrobenzyl esterase
MRNFILVLFMATVAFVMPVHAEEAYSTADTKIGVLLADPEAKAILVKHMPKNLANRRFTMAKSFTLRFISSYDENGELTDENLEKMDKEFAALAQK